MARRTAAVLPAALSTLAGAGGARSEVSWRCSTASERWKAMPPPAAGVLPTASTSWTVDANTTFQTIEGFGGCFNEKGWDALSVLSQDQIKAVMTALFSTEDGCKFRINRMPIGSSDFAMNYYSLDDTPGDYAIQHLNLTRDHERLIPYIKAAMAVQPGLQVWGSPWTGPEWMKDSAPQMPGNEGCGSLSPDPRVRAAYALYLARAAAAYRAAGLNFIMLAVQNEPNQGSTWDNETQSCGNSYPKMHWTGEQLREFIRDHLGPTFEKEGIADDVMIFLSTLPVSDSSLLEPALNDSAALKYLSGVGLQYGGQDFVGRIHQEAPQLKTWETETSCGNGVNDWAYGEQQWTFMRKWIKGADRRQTPGVSVYSQWNMVLDETGRSGWNWKQSAMITVNRTSKEVTYNPHFYAVKHYSHYVEAGAKVLGTSGDDWTKQQYIAFRNPGGGVVVGAANKDDADAVVSVQVGAEAFTAALPARSFNTFTVGTEGKGSAMV